MALVPKPDQVMTAAGNIAHKLLYGGFADLRPMPRTLIDSGTLREVYHYRPAPTVPESGDPVLLVTPLAAPAICFDLRRDCSLVEHFVMGGRPTYLVEYGQVSFKDRSLGMEHWIEEVIPSAVEAVSKHADGRPVHLIGWSLGGIFSTLVAASRLDLPIGSVTVVGSPFDVKQVPLIAPFRPLLDIEGIGPLRPVTRFYRAAGGVPRPLVRWGFQLSSFQKVVTKPLAIAQHLDDAEWLAQIEAVDRFTDNMIAYPGRTFGQLYHRFVKGNALASGSIAFGDHQIEVKNVKAPVLIFAGATDGIAPVASVQALQPLLTGSKKVRFEVVPGGHLGMLTGRAARRTTWLIMDEWIDAWTSTESTPEKKAAPAKKRAAAKKAVPKKKPAAKKTVPKLAPKPAAPPAVPEPEPDAIGVNPVRRFGSGGSRALST